MSKENNPFNDYTKKAHKTESFGSMMKMFEKFGALASGVLGLLAAAKNADLSSIMSIFKSKFGIDPTKQLGLDKLKELSKLNDIKNKIQQGLTDPAGMLEGLLGNNDLFNGIKDNMFGSALLDMAKTYINSISKEWLNGLTSFLKQFIPEQSFLTQIKLLYRIGSDQNYHNTLRLMCLKKDLVVTLDWLDGTNDERYDIRKPNARDAFIAAKYGAFRCASYIALKILHNRQVIAAKAPRNAHEQREYLSEINRHDEYIAKVIHDIITYSYDNFTVINELASPFNDGVRFSKDLVQLLYDFRISFFPCYIGQNDTKFAKHAFITDRDIDIIAPFFYFGGQKFFDYENSVNDKNDRPQNYNEGTVFSRLNGAADLGTRNGSTRGAGSYQKGSAEGSLFGQIDKLGNKLSDLATVGEKTYIDPRNGNIKKIYVYMADLFNVNYDDEKRLIHKPLHERLSYPIITPEMRALQEALNKGEKGPLHLYLNTKTDRLRRMIHDYILSIEHLLFDPSQASWAMYGGDISLPEFRGSAQTESQSSVLDKCKPKEDPFIKKKGFTYADFYLYKLHIMRNIDGSYLILNTITDIASLSVIITRKNPRIVKVKLIEVNQIDFVRSKREGYIVIVKVPYLFFYTERFDRLSDADKRMIETTIITKALVEDMILKQGKSVEDIASMYPDIAKSGSIARFNTYASALTAERNKPTIPPSQQTPENGVKLGDTFIPFNKLFFYKKINNKDMTYWSIEDIGVVRFSSSGTILRRYLNSEFKGLPQGIACYDGEIYVQSGESEPYYLYLFKNDQFIRIGSVPKDKRIVYNGTGIASATQMSFYTHFFYDGKIFKVNKTIVGGSTVYNGLLCIDEDKTKTPFTTVQGLPSNTIYGTAFLPSGMWFVVADTGLYRTYSYKETPLQFEKIDEYADGKFKIIDSGIGSIITTVEPNPDLLPDFDINDRNVHKSLMMKYSKKFFSFFVLQEKINTTGMTNVITVSDEEKERLKKPPYQWEHKTSKPFEDYLKSFG